MALRTFWRPSVAALALFLLGSLLPGGALTRIATARADQLNAATAAVCVASAQDTRCVQADPGLTDALDTLSGLSSGRELLATAGSFGVTAVRGPLPQELYGRYLSASRTVVVNGSLDGADVRERAAVLAHELQHAADHAAGRLKAGDSCLDVEAAAYARMGHVWREMWGGALPPARTTLSAALNTLARWSAQGDDEVRLQLAHLQTEMCGVG
jgi:hypothetical protein